MVLAMAYDSGEELWTCHDCERALSIRWNPFRRTVINHGDAEVPHHGSKGGLVMTARTLDP
jgi:hypothetical protein